MKLKTKVFLTVCLLLAILFGIDSFNGIVQNITGPNLKKVDTVVVGRNKVTVTDTKGKTSTTYVPPGGKVTVTIKPDPKDPKKTVQEVKIKDWGFSKDPGIGLTYSGKILPQLDLRFFFYKRYSAVAGVNLEYVNLGVYRHVDDLIGFENLEIGINAGKGFDGSTRYGTGVRMSF